MTVDILCRSEEERVLLLALDVKVFEQSHGLEALRRASHVAVRLGNVDDRRDIVGLEALLDALAHDGVLEAGPLLLLKKESILADLNLLVGGRNGGLVVILAGEQCHELRVLGLHF